MKKNLIQEYKKAVSALSNRFDVTGEGSDYIDFKMATDDPKGLSGFAKKILKGSGLDYEIRIEPPYRPMGFAFDSVIVTIWKPAAALGQLCRGNKSALGGLGSAIFKDADKYVRQYFTDQGILDEKMERLINITTFDLYYGIYPPGEEIDGYIYPGWDKATDIIREKVIDNVPRDLYVSEWGDVLENEPEGWEDEETGEWVEPLYEEWYHYEYRNILAVILGQELSRNI